MKILICSHRDITSLIALNFILKNLNNHEFQIVVGHDGAVHDDRLSDLENFESGITNNILFPIVEKYSSRCKDKHFLTFNEIEKKYSINIRTFQDINTKSGFKYIKNLAPDLVLSIRFRTVFKKHILDLPIKYGLVNMHSGWLPEFRGIFSLLQAMVREEEYFGCTLHYIDEGIDTGDIIARSKTKINYKKDLLWNLINIYERSRHIVDDFLLRMEAGQAIEKRRQDEKKAKYFSFPSDKILQTFFSKGFKLVDEKNFVEKFNKYF